MRLSCRSTRPPCINPRNRAVQYLRLQASAGDLRQVELDADHRKQRWLEVRSFVADDTVGEWARDNESGNYLIRVPPFVSRAMDAYFFMRYKATTYALRVKGRRGPEVCIDDYVDEVDLYDLRAHIAAAFQALGLCGRPFIPEFGSEWQPRSLD